MRSITNITKYFESIYYRDVFDVFRIERWGYHLAAAILAASAATIAYQVFDLPLQYEALIVGNSAWSNSTKFHDYLVLFVLVGSYFVSLIGVSILASRLATKISPEAEDGLHSLIVLLCSPAGLWLTSLLTERNDSLWLLLLSGVLLSYVIFLTIILLLKKHQYWHDENSQFVSILQKLLLTTITAAFAIAALGVLASRLGTILETGPLISTEQVFVFLIVTQILCAIYLLSVISRCVNPSRLERVLDRSILVLQTTFPAFFLLLIPTPWMSENQVTVGYPMSNLGWIVMGLFIAFAIADLFRRFEYNKRNIGAEPAQLYSIACIIGVLIFLKASPVPLPLVSVDDYHFGEMLVPWWTLSEFNMLPFWDYSPARGIMNYFQGAAASVLFDGTAATFSAVIPFIYAAILFTALPILSKAVGPGIASLSLFLAPYINGLSEIHILITAFICILCLGCLTWKSTNWIAVWSALAVTVILFAPGQGALAVMATAPLAFFVLSQGLKKEPSSVYKVSFLVIALTVILGLATPLGKMFFGAIRYGYEQSSINSVAHGIAWEYSFSTAKTNPWIFEIIRTSWLFVAIWAGLLILKMRLSKWAPIRLNVLVYAVPIFLLTILFIIRSAGRIDVGISRLGYTSMWALSMLLPLLLFTGCRNKANTSLIFAWVTLTGLIFPYFGGVRTNFANRFDPIPVETNTESLTVGSKKGLPGLGTGSVDPEHIHRLITLKQLLDAILDSDETYLDASGRHAQYFYVGRRPPIETGSVYNLVAKGQQLRAISSLEKNPPQAILIGADNILFDGGPLSFRSPLLYRYIILQPNYMAVNVNGLYWLIDKSRMSRVPRPDIRLIAQVDDTLPSSIHKLFKITDLRYIPASWGHSAVLLESEMTLVHTLKSDSHSLLHSIEKIDNSRFMITGIDPFIRFNISDWNLMGREAGVLSFDFSCEQHGPDPILELYWASSQNNESEQTVLRFNGVEGRLIIPLDADPAWLLADKIKSIRLDIANHRSCRSFSIDNIKLFQRANAFNAASG